MYGLPGGRDRVLEKAPSRRAFGSSVKRFSRIVHLVSATLREGVWLMKRSSLIGPTVDGDLIPGSPYHLIEEGQFTKRPLLIGTSRDE